jgi:hypothetical protein
MIPKVQHRKPLLPQPLVSLLVTLVAVLTPIRFNNQLGFQAHKIDDIGAYWLLPLEFQAHETLSTKIMP